MKCPAIAEVPQFSFNGGTNVDSDIIKTLENLVNPSVGGWFSVGDGSLWFAAGLKVTAFETLSINAVVVVSWNPDVKLGIFRVAVADIPKGSYEKFSHVELGVSAVLDIAAEVMKFQAQL